MRIKIPVIIDINDDEMEAMAHCCGVTVERYRQGCIEDKKIIIEDLLEKSGFIADLSRVEVIDG